MSYVIVNNVRYEVKEAELILSHKGINKINEIEGINSLSNLVKLDLSHNNITEINGLDNLKNLRYLFLNNNRISEIKGLDSLTKLMVLHLEANQISELKGLENLNNLNSLHIANNNITEIKGIDYLKKLKLLDLGPKDSQISFQKTQELRTKGVSLKDSWSKHKTQQEIKRMRERIGALICDLFISAIIMIPVNYYISPSVILGVGIFFLLLAILYFPCLLMIYIVGRSDISY